MNEDYYYAEPNRTLLDPQWFRVVHKCGSDETIELNFLTTLEAANRLAHSLNLA